MLGKYQEALNKLVDSSYEFASKSLEAFEIIIEVLETKDTQKLKIAKELIKNTSKAESKIDMKAIETLALYAPEATDLRRVVSLLKATSEFSRISDYIRSQISTLSIEILNEEDLNGDGTREAFYKSTLKALKNSVELIKTEESNRLNELIREISIEESKCDDFVSIIEKNIVASICENEIDITIFTKKLNSVRKLERISDRCVNIAKLMKYAIEGGKLKL